MMVSAVASWWCQLFGVDWLLCLGWDMGFFVGGGFGWLFEFVGGFFV